MAGETIEAGDLVQLKSGGPQMTVDNIYHGKGPRTSYVPVVRGH